MLRVIERGCRFREIDGVLRNVGLFLLRIPFKSHRVASHCQNMGKPQYKLQYIFMENLTLACQAFVADATKIVTAADAAWDAASAPE
jgi:hypothetical protein